MSKTNKRNSNLQNFLACFLRHPSASSCKTSGVLLCFAEAILVQTLDAGLNSGIFNNILNSTT